jgi:hypothetical protein
MSYYIEDQITGMVDGYYMRKDAADGVAEGLNLITRDHLFIVKDSAERRNLPIHDAEFLGSQVWFIRMVSEGFDV